MIGKSARLAGVLGAAVGIPFVAMNENLTSSAKAKYDSWFGQQDKAGSDTLLDFQSFNPTADDSESASGQVGSAPTLSGSNVKDLCEVFRLDITTQWITQRWSRVSAVRRGQGFKGMRVPLVTGTRVDDLAGSLTYYFDDRQMLRRITFQGTTGDPTKLIMLVNQRFGLYSEPSLGAGLYLSRWNGEPTSVLSVTHAPVIRANTPHSQFNVLVELNRPGLGFGLSNETKSMLTASGHVSK